MLGDTVPPTSLNLSLSRHRHRGVRILSIDGGGTRGIGSIQTLRELQRVCGGRPIYSMFDIVCGTSTGGILAVALGLLRRPLDEVEQMYRDFSSRVFESSSVYRGALTGGMYNPSPLESIISNYMKRDYDIGTYGWHRRDCWNDHDDHDSATCRVFVVASAVGTSLIFLRCLSTEDQFSLSYIFQIKSLLILCSIVSLITHIYCGYSSYFFSSPYDRYDSKAETVSVSQLQLSNRRIKIQTPRYDISTTLVLSSSHDCCSWIFSRI